MLTLNPTTTGTVLVLLSVGTLMLRPAYFYWLAIFFVPFSATAIINIGGFGNGATASAISAPLYFALLAILFGKPYTFFRDWKMSRYIVLVAAFLLIVLLSWMMPYLLDGNRVMVCSANLQKTDCLPLRFSWRNVTQSMYLVIWLLFSIVVMRVASQERGVERTMKAIAWSTAFVSLWGMMQWTIYRYGYTYPSELFNNSASPYARGYLGDFSALNIKRVSSVAVEPSILAQHLLSVIPLLAVQLAHAKPGWSRAGYAIVLLLGCLILLSTATTTAIVGLIVLSCLFLAAGVLRVLSTPVIKLQLGAIFLATVMYASVNPNAHLLLENLVTNKIETLLMAKTEAPQKSQQLKMLTSGQLKSYSTVERFAALDMALGYFKQSPFLGVGWRAVTSPDTVVTLLANVGLIGLLGFTLLLGHVLFNLAKTINAYRKRFAEDAAATDWLSSLMIALLVSLVINQVGGFGFVFGYLWVLLGLAAAAPKLLERSLAPTEIAIVR